jgi:hypothetical protein
MLKKVLFVVVTAVVVSNSYGLTVLPSSSLWQGGTVYDGLLNVSAYIEYAVYERDGGDEISSFGLDAVGTGAYIYAYQIFTDPSTGYDAIESFVVPGTTVIDTSGLDGIGTLDDGTGDSIDGTPVNDGSTIAWTFEAGTLVDGKQSWFLVFSSDASPIAGDYELTITEENPFPTPGGGDDSVPEPATIALIGLGIIPAIMKKKRQR